MPYREIISQLEISKQSFTEAPSDLGQEESIPAYYCIQPSRTPGCTELITIQHLVLSKREDELLYCSVWDSTHDANQVIFT